MLRLYKKQKLCGTTAIDALFKGTDGVEVALAFPIRAVWRENNTRHSNSSVQFLVSVPKRRLRHAVDRVKMRRRIREAFRLNWQQFSWPEGHKIDVAFIYVDSSLQPYERIERSMLKLLQCVCQCGC